MAGARIDCNRIGSLEGELGSDLDVAGRIGEVAIRVGHGAEHGLTVRARGVKHQGAPGDGVRAVGNTSNVDMVSHIECFSQNLKLIPLLEWYRLREPQINHLCPGIAVGVASSHQEAIRSAGTVIATAGEAPRSVTAGYERVGKPGLRLVNRRQFPAVGQVTRESLDLPWGIKHPADDEALTNIKAGVPILALHTVREQQVVGIGERCFVLAEIDGVRPGVVDVELNVVAEALVQEYGESVIA